jgi:transposase
MRYYSPHWDKTGFWLSQKRLEKERYPWPETKEAVQELSVEIQTLGWV